MRIRFAVMAFMVLSVMLPGSVSAHWVRTETQDVPIERLLSNLEGFETRLQKKQVKDRAQVEFEIGRLHSMAYAEKIETAQVVKSPPRRNTQWDEYEASVKKRIAQNCGSQQLNKFSGITVSISISKKGKLVENKIEESSGNDSLDKQALAAIAATEMEPLPSWSDYDQMGFTINFDELSGSIGVKLPETMQPFFDYAPDFRQFRVKPSEKESEKKLSQDHLLQAIAHLEKALALDPSLLAARMGLAWCLDQAGDKDRAIGLYREVFKNAYEKESRNQCGGLAGFSFTIECGQYLCSLLNRTGDKAEMRDIENKMKQVGETYRAITPLIVPLTMATNINSLVDRAHVQFDLDGQGAKYCRSWITPKAGWLVFDKTGSGKIDSGLQLIGEVTFWVFWKNAYDVLSALDDNHDGKLTGNELTHLAIWNDANSDGIAQADEVKPLAYWHIAELSCSYGSSDNLLLSGEGVTFEDGSRRPTYDVWIEQEPRRTEDKQPFFLKDK